MALIAEEETMKKETVALPKAAARSKSKAGKKKGKKKLDSELKVDKPITKEPQV